MRILFFDTETSGKALDFKQPYTNTYNWPRIVQYAAVLQYDRQTIHQMKVLINTGETVYTPEAKEVHGITEEFSREHGFSPKLALTLFNRMLSQADFVCAHNMRFDKSVFRSEFLRQDLQNLDLFGSLPVFDTMQSGTAFCKIPAKKGFKWPTLQELHNSCFNCGFEGAHDAFADTNAMIKCFWHLVDNNYIQIPAI